MLILLALGCNRDADCSGCTGLDLQGPIVRVGEIPPHVFGTDVLVEAVVQDSSGIRGVELFHRPETAVTWHRLPMVLVGGDPFGGWVAQAEIPGNHVYTASLFWYVEAVDASENENVGCSPASCDGDPYRLMVVAGD